MNRQERHRRCNSDDFVRCNLYRSLLISEPGCRFARQRGEGNMALDGTGDTSMLLGSEDVPPVLEDNASGRSPFLLTCDHYGRAIPRRLGDLGLPASELRRHIAWDIGIAGVAEALSKHLDAHLIAQRYSRLVIDCNRPPERRARSRASAKRPRFPPTKVLRAKPRRHGAGRSSIPTIAASARRSTGACAMVFRRCWCRCTASRRFTPE